MKYFNKCSPTFGSLPKRISLFSNSVYRRCRRGFRRRSLLLAGSLLAFGYLANAEEASQPFGRPLIPDMMRMPALLKSMVSFIVTPRRMVGAASFHLWYASGLDPLATLSTGASKIDLSRRFQTQVLGAQCSGEARWAVLPVSDPRWKITAAVSDSLKGPFHPLSGRTGFRFPLNRNRAIDAEIFRDDDGQGLHVFIPSPRGETQARPVWSRWASADDRHG